MSENSTEQDASTAPEPNPTLPNKLGSSDWEADERAPAEPVKALLPAQHSSGLAHYDAACRAVAAAPCRRGEGDPRQDGSDEGLRHAGEEPPARDRRRRDPSPRGARRLGELIAQQRMTVGLNTGAKGNPGGRGAKIVRGEKDPAQPPTLAEAGIEKRIAAWRETAEAEQGRVVAQVLRPDRSAKRRATPDAPLPQEAPPMPQLVTPVDDWLLEVRRRMGELCRFLSAEERVGLFMRLRAMLDELEAELPAA